MFTTTKPATILGLAGVMPTVEPVTVIVVSDTIALCVGGRTGLIEAKVFADLTDGVLVGFFAIGDLDSQEFESDYKPTAQAALASLMGNVHDDRCPIC